MAKTGFAPVRAISEGLDAVRKAPHEVEMAREIVLDTETTGLDPRSGHRLIEIACIAIEDLLPTGESFHRYIDPERDIDVDAEKVHGISRALLRGKPRFEHGDICEAFLSFIGDAPLVAHNAQFDRGFVNAELERIGRPPLDESRWICTYELAKRRFPGMYNSLDALCKRFKISLSEREKHGALIDTRLLSMVYLELQGGKERDLGLGQLNSQEIARTAMAFAHPPRPRPMAPRSTDAERSAHATFVAKVLQDKAVWLKLTG